MKTHEFAYHLELLARLLRSLPDTELDNSLTSSLQVAIPGITSASTKDTKRAKLLPAGIENQLPKMSPAQIEAFLDSGEEAFTVSQLSELAERLGIATSKRQGKSALINQITRHFEAGQMHSIIRSARSDEN